MTPALESVVLFKWTPRPGYRSTFQPSTVNSAAVMVRRHYPRPIRVICVTDDPSGIDAGIEIVPLWQDFAELPSPHGGNNPSCYRRLRLFHPEIASLLGQRFVSLDLDCVVTGDLSPLWDRPEAFMCWGDTNSLPGSHYNGSMVLMTAGARPKVWTEFDPATSPRKALKAGCFGSDQGWLSYCLGPGEARWSTQDGVYSYRNHIKPTSSKALPKDARIVFFHGKQDPWASPANQLDWVRTHYPSQVAA
jgi:hypothetical protein